MEPSTISVVSATRELRIVDPLRTEGWDTMVGRLPGSSVFHSAAWAQVLRETYGFKPVYFCRREADGALTALLPLMEINSWLTGRRGVGLPFSDECSALSVSAANLDPLLSQIRAHGTARRWRYVEVRGQRHLAAMPASTEFHGHHLALQDGFAALHGRFTPAVRRNIRKAENGGIQVTFTQTLDDLKDFYGLLCLTRRRHGVPPQPFSFFVNLHRLLLAPSKGVLVLAHLHGRAIAGGLFLHFGTGAVYKFGASHDGFRHLRPNNLVMARAIEWHAARGFKSLDFGRTSLSNEGLRSFKLGWGAVETPLRYVRFSPSTGKHLEAPDKASHLSQALFHRLPLLFSRFIGAALYRHVA